MFCGNVQSTFYLITPMKDSTKRLGPGIPYVICSASATLKRTRYIYVSSLRVAHWVSVKVIVKRIPYDSHELRARYVLEYTLQKTGPMLC